MLYVTTLTPAVIAGARDMQLEMIGLGRIAAAWRSASSAISTPASSFERIADYHDIGVGQGGWRADLLHYSRIAPI